MSVRCFCGSWDHEPRHHPDGERDRLAADLHGEDPTSGGPNAECGCYVTSDRLIALGWTRLDEERRVIDVDAWMPQHASYCANRLDDECICGVGDEYLRMLEASVPLAIAKAYREDTVRGEQP